MMRKIFWDNPYQTTLTTQVSRVDGNWILFEETIIFSFSGGQESDKAYINGIPIIDSKIEGNLIYYALPPEHHLQPGTQVTMEIDWSRRHKLMRLHFAAELVLEIITQKLNIQKIGAHIAEDKARIDFISPQNISLHFEDILHQYNNIIAKDAPIITGFSDEKTQRRFWEIEGFSKVPCGGTHVKSTKEVGYVKLKRINVGSSKERVEIRLCTA